jgi:hypothetical protein
MTLVARNSHGLLHCYPRVCRNQEAAFWLLAALVEDILQPDTYSSNLVGCQVRSSSSSSSARPAAAAHP